MRGKNTFDLARSGQLSEMRGKNTFDLARSGRLSEMRGKNTFDSAEKQASTVCGSNKATGPALYIAQTTVVPFSLTT
ncbi:hypothetical protein D3C75_1104610 [compost metagenome]